MLKMKRKILFRSRYDRFHNYRVQWKYAFSYSKKYSKKTRPRRTMTIRVRPCTFIVSVSYVSLLSSLVIQKLQDNLYGMFDPLNWYFFSFSSMILLLCNPMFNDSLRLHRLIFFLFLVVLLLRLRFRFPQMIFITILKLCARRSFDLMHLRVKRLMKRAIGLTMKFQSIWVIFMIPFLFCHIIMLMDFK